MSTIADRILQDLKTAMKAKDPLTTTVLRNLKSALKYAAIEQGGANTELDEAQTQAVIRKEIKKREDAIESFTKGGRPELAEQERREAEILLGYLPAALPEQEVQSIIDEVIQTQGATSRKDMGSVMKAVQERTGVRSTTRPSPKWSWRNSARRVTRPPRRRKLRFRFRPSQFACFGI